LTKSAETSGLSSYPSMPSSSAVEACLRSSFVSWAFTSDCNEKTQSVKEALKTVGVTGMTVSEVKGFGRQKGHTEVYRGAEYEIEFIPKIQLDIAVSDDKVDSVIKAIQESANTNKIGDGKIFVTSVEQAVRIRTGETGDSAV
jgi:nitrogen regulatory protein P-II 2